MDEKLKRVVYYIRVSSEEQKVHGLSLDAQRMKLDEYAKAHNLIHIGTYADEGVSGRKLIKNRPELQKMLHDAAKGLFDLIIFIKLDRYFRSVAEYHECQKVLDEYGVKWAATEEKYDLTTANGRAFVNMKLTIAELEADQTGERIRLVNDYKIKEGYVISGKHPVGYKIIRKDGRPILVKNEEESEIVMDFIDRYETTHNMTGTVEYINRKYEINKRYPSWRRLLANPILYGYHRGNDHFCEPYITKERFDRIQEILACNIRHTKFLTYLFQSLVYCTESGRHMTGTYSGDPHAENPVLSYKCYDCPHMHSLSERKIEKYILNKFMGELRQHIANLEVEERQEKPAKKSLKKLESEKEKLNYMFQKSRISIEVYDEEYAKIEAAIRDAQRVQQPPRDLSGMKRLLDSDFESTYNLLNREGKRNFWHAVIDRIYVTDRQIAFTLKDEFVM